MAFDVAIIGGGIVGLSLAAEIGRLGGSAIVIERRTLGWGSTIGSLGVVYPVNPLEFERDVFTFSVEAASMYEDYVSELSEHSIPVGWIRPGLLQVAHGADGSQTLFDVARAYVSEGIDCGIVDGSTVELMLNGGARSHDVGVYFPCAAHVYACDLVSSLAIVTRARGGQIREGLAVSGLDLRLGRCHGVVTENGIVAAGATVICSGAWSTVLPGLAWPPSVTVRPIRGQAVLLRGPVPDSQRPLIYSQNLDVIHRPDGHIIVGSTHEDVGYGRICTPQGIQYLLSQAFELLPSIAEFEFIEGWSGLRPAASRQRPIADRHPEFDGLYMSSGFNRNGVFFAPLCAQLFAPKVLAAAASGVDIFSVNLA